MARRDRGDLPLGVVLIALGFLFQGLLFALIAVGIWEGSQLSQVILSGGEIGMILGIGSVFVVALIVLQVVAALLLLRRHRTGWVIAMLFTCAGLATYLVGWWLGVPEYPRMAIYAAMAFYLNQREVRAAFGGGAPAPGPRRAASHDGSTT